MKQGAHRRHAHYAAFIVHRVSGVLLTLFLPAHFFVLALSLETERLDGFLKWSEAPLLKIAETGLVLLLALHMAGGIRLLALEFLGLGENTKTAVALAAGAGVAVALLFALNVS